MKLYIPTSSPKSLNDSKFHDQIRGYDYFFTIERDKWTFTNSLETADIILISLLNLAEDPSLLDSVSEDQILLVWLVETCNSTITPSHVRDMFKNLDCFSKHKKTIIAHTNLLDSIDPQYISNDIMFNREKLYFTEYDYEMCFNKYWTAGLTKSAYSLSNIQKTFSEHSKNFLVPVRVEKSRNANDSWSFHGLKFNLKKFLHSIDASMHTNDVSNDIFIKTNDWNRLPNTHRLSFKTSGTFSPAADSYFNTSYVSLGAENIYDGSEIFSLTEKYFDHLIKGNFSLIFSAPGTIHNLKKFYNFQFPDWIDYSYDEIDNLQDRFKSYLESVQEISKLPTIKLHKLYLRDKHILEHNRNIFFSKPYDSLYDKVNSSIQQLGWRN